MRRVPSVAWQGSCWLADQTWMIKQRWISGPPHRRLGISLNRTDRHKCVTGVWLEGSLPSQLPRRAAARRLMGSWCCAVQRGSAPYLPHHCSHTHKPVCLKTALCKQTSWSIWEVIVAGLSLSQGCARTYSTSWPERSRCNTHFS